MKFRSLALPAAIASLTAVEVFAAGPRFLDARAFSMGGVGVASARPAAASFYNPALLAIEHKEKSDDFGMLLPSVMVIAQDEDEVYDRVDDFEDDYLDPFEQSLNTLETTNFATEAEARLAAEDFIDKSRALQQQLIEIDQDGLVADVGVGFSFLVPSKKFAAGIFGSGAARLASRVNYADDALIDGYLTDVQDALDGNGTTGNVLIDLNNVALNYDRDQDFESDVRVVGAGISQAGISLATSFEFSGQEIAIGLSPKIVNQIVYDYTSRVDDFEFDDVEDSEVKESHFNFDLGIASFLDRDRRWMAGLSVLNVLTHEMETEPFSNGTTPESIKIELEPTVLAGVSYQGDAYIIALDAELTERKAILNEDDRQFIGIGAEYDLFETMQFRLGARHNLAGSGDPVFTTGLGFTILGASLEVAALSSADANTVGAALQLGATF